MRPKRWTARRSSRARTRGQPHISAKAEARAARRIVRRAGGPVDVAIVLGSGLGSAAPTRIDGVAIAYDKLGAPAGNVAGHPGVAYAGTWSGKRVVAFAGRAHLYEGHSAHDVAYFVRVAHAAGARAIVLTNAAGALNDTYERGDIMLVRDHINFTGESPIGPGAANPFVNMVDAYAPHLRLLAREHAADVKLREGVYVGLRGPQYETPAECEALRRLGADAVGMSTVLETIAARALGMDVLAFSLITNIASPVTDLSHEEVLSASEDGAEALARFVERVLAAL
jgi:purine-nucleoside phosphorylase